MTTTANWTEAIGFVAAACTTLSFVPQMLKIRKQGGRDLSYLMLSIYLFGLGLWLIYGLRLHAPAVIVANVVGLVLVGASLVMKIIMDARMKREEASRSPLPAPNIRSAPSSAAQTEP